MSLTMLRALRGSACARRIRVSSGNSTFITKAGGENRSLPGVAAQTHVLSAVFDLQEY